MNKKLMFGIGALCVVGSIFVACGSGDVSAPSEEDEISAQMASTVYKNDSTSGTSLSACLKDAACAASLQTPVSSAVASSSSAIVILSSSSIPVVSSSSTVVIPVSSSSGISSPVVSSSSVYVPPTSSSSATSASSTELTGTCAPKKTPISKGETAQWVWTRLTPSGTGGIALQGSSTFTWTMTGATDATATGLGLTTTPATTYAASGSYTASVAVGDFTAKCSALQVNGAAITGTCTANKTTADISASPADTIIWTVAAASTGATITGYTWTGATGTSETAVLAASDATVGTTVAPTVSVTNDDNTVQKITCGGVKVIDSSAPEYELKANNTEISLPAGSSTITMNLDATWHGGTAGSCNFSCNESSGTLTGSVDGVALTGTYYYTASIPITSTISGYSLPVVLSKASTCQVGW
jgi:hypothetical protein